MNCVSGCTSATLRLLVDQPAATATTLAPKIESKSAPRSFFPRKDGYQDNFTVSLSADQASTAHLYILKGKKTVARGAARVPAFDVVKVSAGSGLKPGTYTWVLTVVGANGKTTKTRPAKLLADPRHVVRHTIKASVGAGQLNFENASGACGTAKKSGHLGDPHLDHHLHQRRRRPRCRRLLPVPAGGCRQLQRRPLDHHHR